jgi:hypothetical protein
LSVTVELTTSRLTVPVAPTPIPPPARKAELRAMVVLTTRAPKVFDVIPPPTYEQLTLSTIVELVMVKPSSNRLIAPFPPLPGLVVMVTSSMVTPGASMLSAFASTARQSTSSVAPWPAIVTDESTSMLRSAQREAPPSSIT